MIRMDLRKTNQARSLSAELGVITEADGSCLLQSGGTKVAASVVGPTQPRYSRHDLHDRASVEIDINMCSKLRPQDSDNFEDTLQRKACGKFIAESITDCLNLEQFPRMLILFTVNVIVADGGLLSTALNACVLALLDGGLLMRYVPCSISICAIRTVSASGDIGTIRGSNNSSCASIDNISTEKFYTMLLDPNKSEEDEAAARFIYSIRTSSSGNSF